MNQSLILGGLQALVVIATGVLAFFTWQLARSTSKSVDELQEQRNVTLKALDASNRIAAAAESELEATHEQVAASQTVAEEAVRARTARWEPVLSSRLTIVPGNRPTSVVLENFGTGPALDVVYTVVVSDPAGLKAWFLVGPVNLHADSIQEVELNTVSGIEQASYEASDTSSVVNGVPVRRIVRRFTRAFEGDPAYRGQTIDPREQFGWPPPPGAVFARDSEPRSPVAGDRQEAVLCKCINGHVHRALTYQRSPQEEFDANDTGVRWMEWYKGIAQAGMPPARIPPKPEPLVIRQEVL